MLTNLQVTPAPGRMHFVVPGRLTTRTGGFVYDSKIIDAMRADGLDITVHELPGTYPWPDADAVQFAGQILAGLEDDASVVIDGLAFGVLPDLVAKHATRLDFTALVHHPLALETGLSVEQVIRLTDSERRALRFARRVIVTSEQTRANLAAFGVDAARCLVVLPGTDSVTVSRAPDGPSVSLLCIASVTARKGHGVLVDALQRIADLPWTLSCVGSTERDPDTVARVHEQIKKYHLEDRITLTGELDHAGLEAYWLTADVFVLASHHEGYGMVFDEATARGLPVVASDVGALRTAVPEAARIAVPISDAESLSRALAELINKPAKRQQMRSAALAHAHARRSWPAAGADFARAVFRNPD